MWGRWERDCPFWSWIVKGQSHWVRSDPAVRGRACGWRGAEFRSSSNYIYFLDLGSQITKVHVNSSLPPALTRNEELAAGHLQTAFKLETHKRPLKKSVLEPFWYCACPQWAANPKLQRRVWTQELWWAESLSPQRYLSQNPRGFAYIYAPQQGKTRKQDHGHLSVDLKTGRFPYIS